MNDQSTPIPKNDDWPSLEMKASRKKAVGIADSTARTKKSGFLFLSTVSGELRNSVDDDAFRLDIGVCRFTGGTADFGCALWIGAPCGGAR